MTPITITKDNFDQEVLQSDKFTAGDAQFGFVVLECRDPEIHRVIVEEKNVQEHRYGHDHQLPLGSQGSEETPFPYRLQFLPGAPRDTGHGLLTPFRKDHGERQSSPHDSIVMDYLLSSTLCASMTTCSCM